MRHKVPTRRRKLLCSVYAKRPVAIAATIASCKHYISVSATVQCQILVYLYCYSVL